MSKKKKHKKKQQNNKKHNNKPCAVAEVTQASAEQKEEPNTPPEQELTEIVPSDTEQTNAAEINEAADDADNAEPREKKRRFPVFWTLYALFIIAFVVALYFGIGYLNGILSEYESVQPEYAAEDVFAQHFAEPDIEALIKMSSTEYALFETHEKVVEYLTSQVADKEITYSESSAAGDEGIFTYNVFCGGARFAVFRIEQGDNATEHGFPIYVLKDVRLTFSLPENAYSFVIPEGYTLYANGTEVPEHFVSGEPMPTEAYDISSGKLGIRFVSYRVDGFLSAPEFEVKDKNGAVCEYLYDEENDLYYIEAQSITIKLPAGCIPYIGDCAVAEKYLVPDSTEPSAYNKYLREGAAPLNYVSYRINGFIEMPKVTVKSPNGVLCDVRFDEKTCTYESLPAYDESMRAEYERWILGAFEKLTLYLQLVPGSSKDSVVGYFDTSSDIWRAYAEMNPDWNYEAYSYVFENESVSNFIVYDSEHFSCRVQMHYIGYRGSGKHEDITDKIVFFRKIGGRYYIYNLVNCVALSGAGVFFE